MINQEVNKDEINKLVRLVGQGDENAIELLYTKMYDTIFHFLLKFYYNEEIVRDVISSTFCIIIEKSKNKMFYTNCFSWILTIAKHQLFNTNKKFNNKIKFTDKMDKFGKNINMEKLTLKMAVEKLDDNDQHLLYLLYFHKLKFKEISKILRVSISTIKRRKNEILMLLKESLDE